MMTLPKVVFYNYWATTNGKRISFFQGSITLAKFRLSFCHYIIISRLHFITFICEVI